jgi:hypothetical protein
MRKLADTGCASAGNSIPCSRAHISYTPTTIRSRPRVVLLCAIAPFARSSTFSRHRRHPLWNDIMRRGWQLWYPVRHGLPCLGGPPALRYLEAQRFSPPSFCARRRGTALERGLSGQKKPLRRRTSDNRLLRQLRAGTGAGHGSFHPALRQRAALPFREPRYSSPAALSRFARKPFAGRVVHSACFPALRCHPFPAFA